MRVGTPIRNLLENNLKGNGRIVLGSVMRGQAQGDLDAPITRETPAVIALREAERELFPIAGLGLIAIRSRKRISAYRGSRSARPQVSTAILDLASSAAIVWTFARRISSQRCWENTQLTGC